MNKEKYDVLVFIGRFQPFHEGHKRVIDRALELSKHVLILAGSANRSRDMRNPFTFDERKQMIEMCYAPDYEHDQVLADRFDRIHVLPLNDMMYADERWVEQVQTIVHTFAEKVGARRIGLIGHAKDHSSYYLKLFPTWGSERVNYLDPINATDLRNAFWMYGANKHWMDAEVEQRSFVQTKVPAPVFEFLTHFSQTADYADLKAEDLFIRNYKTSVQKYPRIEHTVDSVVIQSGHVLLIRRRSEPGKGKWALPGGFLNPEETMFDGAIRELREETGLKVPEAVLRGRPWDESRISKTYDDSNRSERGRLITQAFLFPLPPGPLPKVKGSDDADKARWVPLSELNPTEMFEDHYFIIQDMIGKL